MRVESIWASNCSTNPHSNMNSEVSIKVSGYPQLDLTPPESLPSQEVSGPKLVTLCDFCFQASLHKMCQCETKQTKSKMQQSQLLLCSSALRKCDCRSDCRQRRRGNAPERVLWGWMPAYTSAPPPSSTHSSPSSLSETQSWWVQCTHVYAGDRRMWILIWLYV